MKKLLKVAGVRSLSVWCLLVLFTIQQVQAQEANNCSDCACPPGIFLGSCSVRCCKPAIPACDCGILSNRCTCVGSPAFLPALQEQNLRDFAALLRTSAFTSIHAQKSAEDLSRLLDAHAGKQTDLFYTIAERIDETLRQLPTVEKHLVNQWIVSRGGQSNTIP
jgi:hypothetical protein